MATDIRVNGNTVSPCSPVVVVLRPGAWDAIPAAEEFIRCYAGREPASWTDGTASSTVVASQMPVRK